MDGEAAKKIGQEDLGGTGEAEPKSNSVVTSGEVPPKKRKSRDKKFIDLQKQPPKPAPLVQE